ncbi:hypothetical protein NM688_g2772 [Phlebia brevispora]|uniref:Uncharacterized protein n=1 Tax=Phlebia brevispora TaxID=194682 RepID=A0ACC1T7D9_9APHY|nr:hypothetical protein NM688_g2772 [Phlebia brevispora]
MNSILSNLKRRSRSRTKPEFTSPSKAKPLHILPGVTEEDEERYSISSVRSTSPYQSPIHCARRSFGGSATVGGRCSQDITERKRDSRKVVLTGIEGLSFDDFFPLYDEPPRPAPIPPCARPVITTPPATRPLSDFSSKSIVCDGSLDELDLKLAAPKINFDFPASPSTPRTSRSHSPTPSCSSSRTTSTTASSRSASSRDGPITPLTSDDELQGPQMRAFQTPTRKPQRASMQVKKPEPLPLHAHSYEDDEDSDAEDAAWIVQSISDAFILSTPSSPISPMLSTSNVDLRARPDSLPPPPRMRTTGRSRFSKPLPVVPRLSIPPHSIRGPSIQLDPAFHSQANRHPAIPSRPPPPPPIRIDCPSPTMEEKTDELLRLLANAALDSGFLGTGLSGSLSPLLPSAPVTPSSAYIPETPATVPSSASHVSPCRH